MKRFLAVLIVPFLAAAAFAEDSQPAASSDAKAPSTVTAAPATTPATVTTNATDGKPAVAPTAKPSSAGPQTDDQKTFYALGLWLSQRVTTFNLSASEFKYVRMGLSDAVVGHMSANDMQTYMQTYGPKLQEMAQKRGAAVAAKEQAKALKQSGPEKEKGKAYAEAAAKEKDAYKSNSGMVFIPIKEGTGAEPKDSDTVKVHYVGTLIDGTEFDSSVKRGQPAEFPLKGVIPCWTEGVQKIKVGGKAKLVCPSSIAYGDQGRPPTIPGGATLVFQVELLDITTKSADKN
jgi:FKBP-type peptidyl-prolyl cis-trans isomerase FkpA